MSIQVIKLNCGDEVMGNMNGNGDGDTFVVEKPARVIIVPTENEGMGVALMPWFPYCRDEKVSVKEDAIITRFNPTDELKNEYRKHFGSGLDIPTPQIIS